MDNKIKDNKTNNIIEIKEDKTTLFLYDTVVGRIIAKVLSLRLISGVAGSYMNSKLSKKMIKNFIIKNNIDMSDYEEVGYKSFNDFFTRKIKTNARQIDYEITSFVSPCDAKLMVYKINENSEFKIKDSFYSVRDLINDDIAAKYLNGYALIFRLCVDDYHRYCYIDSGKKEKNKYIKGILHTVRPIVLKHHNIYKRNAREWTILHTDNFDDIIHVEVGAMMVGKIANLHEEYTFKKGEEKGYFMFGGSTIVLLVKGGVVKIGKDILTNSNDNIETIVKYGEKIGEKITSK